MRTQQCPICRRDIEVRDNGIKPRNTDGRTDPQIYVVHSRTAVDRNGLEYSAECPASNKNRWMAENSW